MYDNTLVPLRIATLVVKYSHGRLSEKEHDELNEWIEALDENEELFGEMIGPVSDRVVLPDEPEMEEGDLVEDYVAVTLICRSREKSLSEVEQRFLEEWMEESEQNRMMYEALQDAEIAQRLMDRLKGRDRKNNPGNESS